MIEMAVSSSSEAVGKRLVELELPHGMLIALIRREGEYFIPDGGTILQAKDRVLALGGEKSLNEVERCLGPRRDAVVVKE